MKRILRILMIAICCMVSCNMVANAGNDKPISVNALPAKAQTLLSQHFNGQKVMLATIESGVGADGEIRGRGKRYPFPIAEHESCSYRSHHHLQVGGNEQDLFLPYFESQ